MLDLFEEIASFSRVSISIFTLLILPMVILAAKTEFRDKNGPKYLFLEEYNITEICGTILFSMASFFWIFYIILYNFVCIRYGISW